MWFDCAEEFGECGGKEGGEGGAERDGQKSDGVGAWDEKMKHVSN